MVHHVGGRPAQSDHTGGDRPCRDIGVLRRIWQIYVTGRLYGRDARIPQACPFAGGIRRGKPVPEPGERLCADVRCDPANESGPGHFTAGHSLCAQHRDNGDAARDLGKDADLGRDNIYRSLTRSAVAFTKGTSPCESGGMHSEIRAGCGEPSHLQGSLRKAE